MNVTLAQNVANKLREMSRGSVGITPTELADAILHERMANPPKAYVNLMRDEVYGILHEYFPYAKRDTKLKLGSASGAHYVPEPPVQIQTKDGLIRDLLAFINDVGANDLMPEDLIKNVEAYK